MFPTRTGTDDPPRLVERAFPLSDAEAAAPFDVRLVARDWAVVTVRGRSWVASARLDALESRP